MRTDETNDLPTAPAGLFASRGPAEPRAWLASAGGVVAVMGPGLFVLANDLAAARHATLALVSSALITLGGLTFAIMPLRARLLTVAGLLSGIPAAVPAVLASPRVFLLGAVALIVIWRVLREGPGLPVFPRWSAAVTSPSAARAAGICASVVCMYVLGSPAQRDPRLAYLGALAAVAVADLFAAAWVIAGPKAKRIRRSILALALGVGSAAAGYLHDDLQRSLLAAALGPISAMFLVVTYARPSHDGVFEIWGRIAESPSRLVVVAFLGLCTLGTLGLVLPASATPGTRIPWIDAAFTATSAVCVTGLIGLDTPTAFSGFGQGVILLLIQLGGLGIMSFYAVTLGLFGRRLSMRHELAVATVASIDDQSRLFGSLRQVLGITLAAEAAGTLLLFTRFATREPMLDALWRALFTSISAFCNAGFALQSDSLIGYQRDPVVLHTVATLIVFGGLSPYVIATIPAVIRRRRPVALEVKLVLITTGLLLALGFALFLAFEWSLTLHNLSIGDRLHNAWFQSVTLRTAGFNSVETAATGSAAQLLMMAMMFIGGSPGGTAGGIKTTTGALLALAVLAALRGRSEVTAYHRKIGHASVYKAAAVATVGIAAGLVALTAILLTQRMPANVAAFEVISALGTVGLSIGGTARLDEVGKIIIMLCMFMGRVGPLTLFLLLLERRPTPGWRFPEEEVDVG